MATNFWDYPLRKHHKLCDQIRPLINPLADAFGISHFCYFFVSQEGHSACLGSHPAWMEHYLYNDLFLHNPFLKTPQLTPEGVFFTKSIKGAGYLESKRQAKTFGIEDSLVLTSKKEGKLQGFSFGLNSHEKNYTLFANELPLLRRFCLEFEKRAKRALHELASEPIDIRPFFGKAFTRQEDQFLLSEKKRAAFLASLKLDTPDLSKREKECLLLYLEGETARSIAAILDLSPRTTESYLESIKHKLNCYQKTELLKKGRELQDYGLLLP